MSRQSGRQEITLLQTLAFEWCRGRGGRLESMMGDESGLQANGPGALYGWNDNHEPIAICFLPEGRNALPHHGCSHHLVITLANGGLELQSSGKSRIGLLIDDPAVRHRIDGILSAMRSGTASGKTDELAGLNASQRLVELSLRLAEAQNDGARVSRRSAREQFVSDLHDWLDGQLENSVKLADAATEFDKSPRQIIRVLKETTGTGFSEHLTMHRLIRARRLLMRTAESVMEVARRSGFNSREQFIRSFSKAFGWTPLQFRKAWNQASLANSSLTELCRIKDRCDVQWLPDGSPAEDSTGNQAHTLIVANALHEIAELFLVDSGGKPERSGVLERGAMVFIHRDLEGSRWMVRTPGSGIERLFTTPADHAIAVITPEEGK